jgi:hypothetical protein
VTTYRGLGFDPTPGDVGAVGALADALRTAGGQATEAHAGLRGAVAASAGWQGAAAEEFRRAGSGALPDRLLGHAEGTGQAADLLDSWAGTLSDGRLQAEQLDRRARALDDQISTAEANVEQASITLSVAGSRTQAEAAAALQEHERTLGQLRDRRSDVIAAARQLAGTHERAAGAVADQLAALAGGTAPTAGITGSPTVRAAGTALGALATLTRRAGAIAGLAPGSPAPRAGSAVGTAAAALAGPAGRTGSWQFGDAASSAAALARVARVG